MRELKILYVTTISNTINAFLLPHIKMLVQEGHQVDVACNIVRPISEELIKLGCKVFRTEFQRTPLSESNFVAYKKLKKLIIEEKYNLIHTHTPVASACVRLACRKMKDVKVVYTAHGFHFYKGAPLKNWLIYFFIEKWLSRYTDMIITINKEDYLRAKKLFKAKRIEYIPGIGFDTSRLMVTVDKSKKRKELGIPEDSFIILSIGELNKNKNHQVVIKAIAKLNIPDIYYLVCGNGAMKDYLRKMTKELAIEKKVKLLGYRYDIAEILKCADVFAFPSFREGLSVALMEAMASGLPIVCSNIRGNSDLVEDKLGGFLVEPYNVNGFSNAIEVLYNSKELRKRFGNYNVKSISKYSIENVIKEMKILYSHFIPEIKRANFN